MTLKDDSGLVKQYAFVSVKDITMVGTGDTVQDAMDDYDNSLNNVSNSGSIDTSGKTLTVTGTVERIASEISGGNTIYELILNEQPNKIFSAVSNISDTLALTKEGDKVAITYIDSTNTMVQVSKFDNTTLSQNAS
jgi:hypothetical protein